ncbi:DUF4837 family protein [Crocinitomix algicola]|uniref:DUF4837 family protein n=1 Tax=Crocinitomix algicola TaxID=1740263 RepID=UPI00082A4746|nr:DUF4837 family protein [Crocinitomix algicola]
MKNVLFIIVSLFALIACDDSNTPKDQYLPEANGKHGEILILMEDHLWEGQIGEKVIEELSVRAPGPYLRPEPSFSYFRKRPEDLNHLNQLNRNILKFMIDTDSIYSETAVIEKRNYFAKNQLFIIIKDSDINRLYEYATNHMYEIRDKFNAFEVAQLKRMYKAEPHKLANEIAEEKFGLSIAIPKKCKLKKEQSNFVFFKRDRSKNLIGNEATRAEGGTFWVQQGFLIWKTPIIPDSNQMTTQAMLMHRDTVLKYNLPGERKDTYMGTEYSQYYEPVGREFTYDGHPAVEIRGLWIYEGKVFVGGGGPFVQYSILNEKRGEIVTICGYVYGPKFEKREYIREIDAVLNTVKIL